MKPEEMVQNIIVAMKEFVAKEMKILQADIEKNLGEYVVKQLDATVSAIVVAPGKDGTDGKDGEPFPAEAVKEMVAENIKAALPLAIAEIKFPEPEKGEKGDSVTVADVMPAIQKAIGDYVKSIAPPADGKDGKDGEDGRDGRDAFSIEIEPSINEEDTYQRGTYAMHRGGLWHSFEQTKGMRGWECVVSGIAGINIDFDGERSITIELQKSDGEPETKNIKIPALIDRGVWEEREYDKGDSVTFSGAIWIALKDTPKGRPGISSDWRLAVKRGGTGKSAFDFARDAGFTGTRQEWLDGLGKRPIVKIP